MRPYFKAASYPASAQKFYRFPWEKDATCPETEDEAREMLERSRVTEQEAAILDDFFAKLDAKRNKQK